MQIAVLDLKEHTSKTLRMYLTIIYNIKIFFEDITTEMKLYLFVTFNQTIFGLTGGSLISEILSPR